MVFLLGGLRAAGMPLLVALAGVLTTLTVLVGATLFGDVSIFSINVVNMLGLGLGIDYGLLMVNRLREERRTGLDLHEAVIRTVATAGTTVVFSALTVAVAMAGLFVFGLPILTSFGVAGLSVVLLCMAAAVTLLPATLAAVGGKIPPAAPVTVAEGRFYRLTRVIQRRAVLVGSLSVGVLVLLGSPFLGARFEIGDARALPRSAEVARRRPDDRRTLPRVEEQTPSPSVADVNDGSPALAHWLDSVGPFPASPASRSGRAPARTSPSSTSPPAAPRKGLQPRKWSRGYVPTVRPSASRSVASPANASTSKDDCRNGSPTPPWSSSSRRSCCCS